MADYLDADLAIAQIDPNTEEIKATPYFEDYLYGVISALGGEGSTTIGDVLNTVIAADKLDYIFGLVKQLLIDTALFVSKTKTSDYTAENKDWVEAQSGVTISLPANPLSNHQVIVSNGDGTTITISGNGNNIKYTSTDTTIKTKRKGTSLHFQYFDTYWRVI